MGQELSVWETVNFAMVLLLRMCAMPGFDVAEFEAESEEEVSVSVGDEIIVHIEVEGWFQITRVADQTRGLVPASYVQVNS